MRTRTPVKRGEMEAVTVILCLGGFPNDIMICQCLSDQLLISSPLTNYDIFLNLVQ